jgi:hypothetical protein
MCGEDLATYRSAQAKLLLFGIGFFVFLIPAFVVNWLFGRFEKYITDTIFDWPSYLISFACWAALVGGILHHRAKKARSPSEDAVFEDPSQEVSLEPVHGPDRPKAAELRESAIGVSGHFARENSGGGGEITDLRGELAALESRIEAERMKCRRALNTINQLADAEYAPPTEGTMVSFGWTVAADTIRDFVRSFPRMSAERDRLVALIDSCPNEYP